MVQTKKRNPNHGRFGELSALALIGQLSPAEYQELRLHLETCATCRAEYRDFEAILSRELPLLHEELSPVESKHADTEVDLGTRAFKTKEAAAVSVEHVASLSLANAGRSLDGEKKQSGLLARAARAAGAV